ncbi:MAG: nitrilase-related carbon-nitrogen hydrolase, partial [Actinomycetes bacterium]
MPAIRLGLAQTNPTVGALTENLAACLEQVKIAKSKNVDLVIFGELAATGYPIEDLAHRESFLVDTEIAIESFAKRLETEGFGDLTVVIGHPTRAASKATPWAIAQNSASVLRGGKIIQSYSKHHLPNYSVFDEYRNFIPGESDLIFEINGLSAGVLICEDIWQNGGPVASLVAKKPNLTLVLNGSPFEIDKLDHRIEIAGNLAKKTESAVAYVNLIGGQDDLVFDGASFVVDGNGKLAALANQFSTDLLLVDVDENGRVSSVTPSNEKMESLEQIWQALVLSLRDYVDKNGFGSVILGLSGGIDSAVCASIAVDAIGAERVFGVSLPSQYSSDH